MAFLLWALGLVQCHCFVEQKKQKRNLLCILCVSHISGERSHSQNKIIESVIRLTFLSLLSSFCFSVFSLQNGFGPKITSKQILNSKRLCKSCFLTNKQNSNTHTHAKTKVTSMQPSPVLVYGCDTGLFNFPIWLIVSLYVSIVLLLFGC